MLGQQSEFQPLHKPIQEQIDHLRSHRLARMRFVPELETQFEKNVSHVRSRRLSRAMVLMALLNAFLFLGDLRSIPGRIRTSGYLRLLFFPLLAFGASLFLRNNPRRLIRGIIVIAVAGVAAGSFFYLYSGPGETLLAHMQASLMLLLLITNIVMRLRWSYALFCSAAYIVTSIAFLRINWTASFVGTLGLGSISACCAGMMLLANYSLERDERLSYLLQQSNDLKNTELQQLNIELGQLNRELEAVSHLDSLTQLANRAAFDRRVQEMWQKAAETGRPLSAVMIDIDHFKLVNDTQGHLYGDAVIRRVAALVQQSMRGRGDFVARYGGEEFVLLLPGADLMTALSVAERARMMVHTAGAPAPKQPVAQPEIGLWTTVSCGVATAFRPQGADFAHLLHAADTALYRAKAEGRNRVCAATPVI